MISNFAPNRTVRKAVVRANGGVVAAQHVEAAAIGARILEAGGNAVDAAVATSFALGVVEPWMSGIGGGGLMVVRHPDGRVRTVDFGMRAPAALDLADYPLDQGEANDLFAWPAVQGNRNMTGPLAIAVPGVVDGVATAHAAWGDLAWEHVLAPAIDLARRGLTVDWYATLIIAQGARGLSKYPASAERFLPDGFAPRSPMVASDVLRLSMDSLADTLAILSSDGPRAFYEGTIAAGIARDVAQMGGSLSASDLAGYHAHVLDPLEISYRDTKIWATPELSAGPTLADTLRRMEQTASAGSAPDAAWYRALAGALAGAYKTRLERMGDTDDGRAAGCTSHFSVTDSAGMTVAVTQTLLSVFGSMVTLPGTGILMNNGIFWFDPRPSRPNSLGPSRRCLSNMCPVIVETQGGVFGIGASGGRRIMPAVAQVAAYLAEFGMDLEDALHHPRIDVSGAGPVLTDTVLPADIRAALTDGFNVIDKDRGHLPSWFANVSATGWVAGQALGGSEPSLPWSDAVAARPAAR